jgi:excisionase family DNA binding protein
MTNGTGQRKSDGSGGSAPPFVLTVREAADLLRISKDLAYELIARGELPSLRLGRRVVVPVRALLDLIDGPFECEHHS